MISKWAKRFYQMAELVASWSKDPSTQVGAVITKQNRIVSVGFNGYPHGVSDSVDTDERELKYLKNSACRRERNSLFKTRFGWL